MDQKNIEDALREMRGQEAEDDPAFRNAVWREIRHRRALGGTRPARPADTVWVAWVRSLLPPVTAAALAVAVMVAWAVGTTWNQPPSTDRVATTSRVLDLGVFDPHADGLAHSKLIVNR